MYKKSNVPLSPEQLPAFLDQEFSNIERSQNEPVFIVQLAVSYAPPAKLINGMTVLADGADWDPGSGAGVYTYYAAAWHKLG